MGISLMETLDAAALGRERYPIKPAEINLVLSAERWLHENGWEINYIRGWNGKDVAFDADAGVGIVIRRRRWDMWSPEGETYPVSSVIAGLNILVVEEILPARFSTYGSKALADYAEALERAADKMVAEQPQTFPYDPSTGTEAEQRAEGLRLAAQIAREHNPNAVFA